MIAVGRVPANARASGCQQAQFRPRQVASSDEQHGTGLQIEKYRQESHPTLASPTYGVDWNYFLYMSRPEPAKRKLFLLYCAATIEFSPSKAKAQRCIFSTTTPPRAGCNGLIGRASSARSKSPRMDAWTRPPWIIWTRSRPRVSTFSERPSRG